jgi:phosphatidate cytidylyltransferase
MLKQRLLTAALLAAILLPSLFFGSPSLWAICMLVFLIGAAWEWARLKTASLKNHWTRVSYPLTFAIAGFVILYTMQAQAAVLVLAPYDVYVYALAALFWLLVALPVMLRKQVQAIPGAVVWLLLGAAWLAVVDARMHGVADLLSIVFLVIAADSFAYFAGRAFGKHKLAPSISPGKTIEGALGGLGGVALVAAIFVFAVPSPSFFSRTWAALGGWACLLWLLLTGLSIVGDLFESAFKRAVGVKDSSQLLPGHGGVLDRVDALLPVLPVAMLCVRWLEG